MDLLVEILSLLCETKGPHCFKCSGLFPTLSEKTKLKSSFEKEYKKIQLLTFFWQEIQGQALSLPEKKGKQKCSGRNKTC